MATEKPGSLARALNGGGAASTQQNSVGSPTAETPRTRRFDSRTARQSFVGEDVGQPVLNIASFDIGEADACLLALSSAHCLLIQMRHLLIFDRAILHRAR
jgi:hypothetical protein